MEKQLIDKVINMEKCIRRACICLEDYGQYVREDWSCLDGRDIRDTLDYIIMVLNGKMNLEEFECLSKGEDKEDYGEGAFAWFDEAVIKDENYYERFPDHKDCTYKPPR